MFQFRRNGTVLLVIGTKSAAGVEQRKGQSKAEHDAAGHCAPECKLRVEARVSIRKAASAVRARTPMKLQTFFSLVGCDLISLILERDLVRKVCTLGIMHYGAERIA